MQTFNEHIVVGMILLHYVLKVKTKLKLNLK